LVLNDQLDAGRPTQNAVTVYISVVERCRVRAWLDCHWKELFTVQYS